MRPRHVIAGTLAGALCALVLTTQVVPRAYAVHEEDVLGTSLDMDLVAWSSAAAERARAAALGSIAHDAAILSSYDPSSEFSRWFRTSGSPVRVSDELFDVLRSFDEWRARTDGALDPAAEAVTLVWRQAARAQRLPAESDLRQAVAAVKRTHWTLDEASQAATHTSDVPLAMSSFVKSYIIDRAARAALAAGARGVVLNIGGDVVVRGDRTASIGIADPVIGADNGEPVATLLIADRAVATSGGYKRGVDIDGHHYSHIVDPRTGVPAGQVLSATVVAPDAATAGALATAFCVLRPDQSRALAAATPGVDFLLILKDGGRVTSPAWHTLLKPPQRGPAVAPVPAVYAAAQGTWDPAMELAVTLEIARPGSFGSRRPYVAVWIEDKDRFPVRTLALWYQKPRWLPELRSWYREDRMRSMAEGSDIASTVSSATRPAGKDTLQWDGRDNAGKAVKAGTYTVCIEAAREHGTYQVIRQEMDFSGVPRHVELPGNVEIAAASLDYHRR
jgi:thiamine biosynthesis lipoprotein ApbE